MGIFVQSVRNVSHFFFIIIIIIIIIIIHSLFIHVRVLSKQTLWHEDEKLSVCRSKQDKQDVLKIA